jgi:phosphate/sulfate permease
MGPLLWKENFTLYLPGKADHEVLPDYHSSKLKTRDFDEESNPIDREETTLKSETHGPLTDNSEGGAASAIHDPKVRDHNKDLKAVDQLPWAHPRRIWATTKLVFTYGITREVIAHQFRGLDDVHRRAVVYENKVEHLWTTAQVCTAMLMSIEHGANDISNGIGPFTTEYVTWKTGVTSAKTDTPLWIKAVGGVGLA